MEKINEKESWKMTQEEYVATQLGKNKYKKRYLENSKALQAFEEQTAGKWREVLNERAKIGRIPDNVLDDFEKRYKSPVNEFRGVKEKGQIGWIPKDIRKIQISKKVIQITLDKKIHERTWAEQRKLITADQTRKLTRTEWKIEKDKYDAAVRVVR